LAAGFARVAIVRSPPLTCCRRRIIDQIVLLCHDFDSERSTPCPAGGVDRSEFGYLSSNGRCFDIGNTVSAALSRYQATDSFAAAILQAANLGDDADTTAAVCGQIAGAYYGASGIPAQRLERLAMREEIASLADRLHSAGRASASYS
jgi:hypothetical protein